MKYLRINAEKAEYWNGKEYKIINEINKKDLLYLLKSAESDKFEIDSYNEKLLPDPAHRIIYKNVTEKLSEFLENKDQFKVQVDKMYQKAISKYSTKLSEDNEIDPFFISTGEEEEVDSEEIPF